MNIQWFPGHMHKAIKEIKEVLSQVDMFIEVLDARIPYSSQNPVLQQVRGDKPGLKVLTKADLADPTLSALWMETISAQSNIDCRLVSLHKRSEIKKITGVCRSLFSHKIDKMEPIRVMVVGIPNVGKSSLINALSGKMLAKTGNEPAVTKRQQYIELDNGVALLDTPGVLWPNIENHYSGWRLGLTGAIKDTAMEAEPVAYFGAKLLLERYPDRLVKRYKLKTLPADEEELLQAIAQYRGALKSGARMDRHRVCSILIQDVRSGALGGLTLETPTMIADELLEVKRIKEAKELEKKERKAERKKRYKRNR